MVDLFFSAQDIDGGSKWSTVVSGELEQADFGIVCLTRQSILSSWLVFEAGALSKNPGSRVCTYLVDLGPDDVTGPLSHFQHSMADQEGTRRLIEALNRRLGSQALDRGHLDRSYAKWWRDLDKELRKARTLVDDAPNGIKDVAHPERIMKQLQQLLSQWIDRPVSARQFDGSNTPNTTTLSQAYEGTWTDSVSGSVLYARVVHGDLFVPYVYATSTELTGHFYGCTLIGNSLIARFRWFRHSDVSGYAMFQLDSPGHLRIVWWLDSDEPRSDDAAETQEMIFPEFHWWDLVRIQKKCPHNALEYFRSLKS